MQPAALVPAVQARSRRTRQVLPLLRQRPGRWQDGPNPSTFQRVAQGEALRFFQGQVHTSGGWSYRQSLGTCEVEGSENGEEHGEDLQRKQEPAADGSPGNGKQLPPKIHTNV